MNASLLIAAMLAQAAQAGSADAGRVDRIRRALAAPPLLAIDTRADESGGAVIRMKVHAWKFARAPWEDDSMVPPNVRPTAPPLHFEFLTQVTPEFFRASVLYPGYPMTPYGGVGAAVPLVPIIEKIARTTRKIRKRMAEDAARAEVHAATAAFEACRAAPARPGC